MLPSVSVVIAAYNYEQYVGEALDSALSQDYPAELLEIVVVDDGSTDRTAEVVRGYVERYPDQVRLVQQQNGGPESAVNRGIAETSGELLALLDADDAWMPGKLHRQVEVLQRRPEVGLVFGDVLPVGADSLPLDRETLMSGIRPIPKRQAARVFVENVALTSTILVRRSLVHPIPPEIPIADWWITLRAAMESEIFWFTDTIVRYRMHGNNRGSGRHGGDGSRPTVRPHMRDIRFKLGAMRILDLDGFTPRELSTIWEGVEESADKVLNIGGSHFANLTSIVEVDSERAATFAASAAEARERGDFVTEALLTLRSLAWDPYTPGMRFQLDEAVARAEEAEAAAAAAAAPAGAAAGWEAVHGRQTRLILSDAEDLLAGDGMLTAYVEAITGARNVRLVIDASRLPKESAGEELTKLVSRSGLDDRDDIDMLALIGPRDPAERARMLAGASAHYRRSRRGGSDAEIPEFTPETARELRRLLDGFAVVGGASAVVTGGDR